MNIFGIDFTSAPRRQKPITLAAGIIDGSSLTIHSIENIVDFPGFERWLDTPGPWVAGIDFPFGQPRKLIDDLGWPSKWAEYVAIVGKLKKAEFEKTLRDYRDSQPAGKKHHYRKVDQLAGAVSPMMMYGVPVGKMFFEGAPRLLHSGVSVMPCRPTGNDRVVVEVYPALAASRWISRAPYKNDTKAKQNQVQKMNRARIVKHLCSGDNVLFYGIRVILKGGVEQLCIDDPSGDSLDAVLCALQAAWAFVHRDDDFGIPGDVDACEGWIVDPVLYK